MIIKTLLIFCILKTASAESDPDIHSKIAKILLNSSNTFPGFPPKNLAVAKVSELLGDPPKSLTWRQVDILIRNQRNDTQVLTHSYYLSSGRARKLCPPVIHGVGEGKCRFTKTSYAARGTVGIIRFDLKRNETESGSFLLTWSVGFSSENWVGLRWYSQGTPIADRETLDQLMNDKDWYSHQNRAQCNRYSYEGVGATLFNEGYLITARLGSAGSSYLKLEISSEKTDRLYKVLHD